MARASLVHSVCKSIVQHAPKLVMAQRLQNAGAILHSQLDQSKLAVVQRRAVPAVRRREQHQCATPIASGDKLYRSVDARIVDAHNGAATWERSHLIELVAAKAVQTVRRQ